MAGALVLPLHRQLGTLRQDSSRAAPSPTPSPSWGPIQASSPRHIFANLHAYFLPSVPSRVRGVWASLGGQTLYAFPVHTTVSCSDPAVPLRHLLALAHGRETLVFGDVDGGEVVPTEFRVIDWRWVEACEGESTAISLDKWTIRYSEEDEVDMDLVEMAMGQVKDVGGFPAKASSPSGSPSGFLEGEKRSDRSERSELDANPGPSTSAASAHVASTTVDNTRGAADTRMANGTLPDPVEALEAGHGPASSRKMAGTGERASPRPKSSASEMTSPFLRMTPSSTPKPVGLTSCRDACIDLPEHFLSEDTDATPRADKRRKLSSATRREGKNLDRCVITPRIDIETELEPSGGYLDESLFGDVPNLGPTRRALSHIHPNSNPSTSTWRSGATSYGKSNNSPMRLPPRGMGLCDTPTPHSRPAHALVHRRTPALSPTNLGNALPTRQMELSVVMPIEVANATAGPLYERKLEYIRRAKADLAHKTMARSMMINLEGLSETERYNVIQAETDRLAEDVMRSVEGGGLDEREGNQGSSCTAVTPRGTGAAGLPGLGSLAPFESGTETGSFDGSDTGSVCGSQALRCEGRGEGRDAALGSSITEGSKSRPDVASGARKRSKGMESRRKLGAGSAQGGGRVRSSARIAQRRERAEMVQVKSKTTEERAEFRKSAPGEVECYYGVQAGPREGSGAEGPAGVPDASKDIGVARDFI